MDKVFKVEFCWATVLPNKIVFDGQEVILTSSTILLKGNDRVDMISRMRGTDTKLISCINTIKQC
jgi:hypothetical protein